MKTRLSLFILCLSLSLAGKVAGEDIQVFQKKESKNSLYILRLYPAGTYSYAQYSRKRASFDSGNWQMKGRKLTLKSALKRHGSNPLLQTKHYLHAKGIYTGFLAMTGLGKPEMETAPSALAQKDWTWNPLVNRGFVSNGTYKATEDGSGVGNNPLSPIYTTPEKENTLSPDAAAFAKNYFISRAAHYSPGYDAMLRSHYSGPDHYQRYVNGKREHWNNDTSLGFLSSEYETVIHESTHGVNSFSNIMVLPGVEISLPTMKLFKSSEFGSLVPTSVKSGIFRYETYVSDKSVVTANEYGIYGLMDEFSAYCNGVRSCLLAARTALAEKDTTTARTFVKQAAGTHFAWYEFRLFAAWYLHHAKEKYPQTYTALMNNKPARTAFTLLDDEFKATIRGMEQLPLGKYGWAYNTEYYRKTYIQVCLTELEKEEVWLNGFRVQGVTLANYKNYLK
ncbi:MAG: hypothetical protein JNL57_00720 [Bacteroidetes bacterium]|nr:hypothetical protein [Bacteroidota bacterium]